MDVKCEANDKPHNIHHLSHNDDDDLNELLNLTGSGQQSLEYSPTINQPNVSNVAIEPVVSLSTAESTDDIQKWLDDVLVLNGWDDICTK